MKTLISFILLVFFANVNAQETIKFKNSGIGDKVFRITSKSALADKTIKFIDYEQDADIVVYLTKVRDNNEDFIVETYLETDLIYILKNTYNADHIFCVKNKGEADVNIYVSPIRLNKNEIVISSYKTINSSEIVALLYKEILKIN